MHLSRAPLPRAALGLAYTVVLEPVVYTEVSNNAKSIYRSVTWSVRRINDSRESSRDEDAFVVNSRSQAC